LNTSFPRILVISSILASLAAALVAQQGMPASPIRFTPAIEQQIRQSVELTGSIESRGTSVVASEVAGLVERLDAREGDTVRRGAPIVHLRRDALGLRVQSAEGALTEAKARLKLARTNLDRSRDMLEKEVISEQLFDTASAEAEAWGGKVAQLTADLARLRRDLDRSTIRSPFNGAVVRERTAVGEWVDVGGPVAEMVDLQNLEVTIQVPSRYYAGLEAGAPATVRFETLGGHEVTGTIRAVVPRADPQARTFPVKISVPNREGKIGVGMLAQVRIPVGGMQKATMVPKDAIVSRGDQKTVWIVSGDNAVRPVQVETGLAQGEWIEVRGELKAGDRIVTRGNERLFPGQTVQPEPQEYAKP